MCPQDGQKSKKFLILLYYSAELFTQALIVRPGPETDFVQEQTIKIFKELSIQFPEKDLRLKDTKLDEEEIVTILKKIMPSHVLLIPQNPVINSEGRSLRGTNVLKKLARC